MKTPKDIENYRENPGVNLSYIENGAIAAAFDSRRLADVCNHTRFVKKTVSTYLGDETIQTSSSAPTGTTTINGSDIVLRADLPKDLLSGSIEAFLTFEIATGSVGTINNFRLLHQSGSADAKAWDSGNIDIDFTGDEGFITRYVKFDVYPNVQLSVDKVDDPKAEQWLNVYWDATTLTSGTTYPSLRRINLIQSGYEELTPDLEIPQDVLAPYPKVNSDISTDDYYHNLKNAQDLLLEYETGRLLFQYPEKLTVSATNNIFGSSRTIIFPIDERDRDGTNINLDVSFYVSGSSTFKLSYRELGGSWSAVKTTAIAGAGWLRFFEEIDVSSVTDEYIELKVEITVGSSIDVYGFGVREYHFQELYKFS